VSLVILDMGSGNTCKNSIDYAKRMVDAVATADSKKSGHRVVLKWQLELDDVGPNKHLEREVFKAAFEHAQKVGYETTSSVFDIDSLKYLIGNFAVPFVKLACDPEKYWLAKAVPPIIPVFISIAVRENLPIHCNFMHCIPKYPATLAEYEGMFADFMLRASVSDHSPGMELWRKYHPQVWEKHFVLEREESNPDAGPFAITPDQLKEVIG
jgi:sialic acid synthase SpsE